VTDNLIRSRGRPRGFDIEEALVTGQRLFHERGYDAVGLAMLTDSLGIKPPSFYKAFGSKAGFFDRVLDRYSATVLPLEDMLKPGRAPEEVLAHLLERAARTYASDPQTRGCLVLEATRGNDDGESAPLARAVAEQRRDQIRAFTALTHPAVAETVTDYIASTMSGLSASAREGMSEDRLVSVARAAALAVKGLLRQG